MAENTETYIIFDGSEAEYTVKSATNANIRRILGIPTCAIFKTNEERIYYAQEADIPPTSYTEENHPTYTFKNIYMQGAYWPALAQQLFYDCPEIIGLQDDEPEIVNKELYESLNREEVRRAFNTFLGKFGCTPYEVRSLLNTWDNVQIRGIMQKLKEIAARQGNLNMPGQTGGEES